MKNKPTKKTILTIVIIALALISMILFMMLGLEPFITKNKTSSIKETIAEIEYLTKDGWDDKKSTELMKTAMRNNFGICIYYIYDGQPMQIFSTNINLESVMMRFRNYMENGIVITDNPIESGYNYEIYKTYDKNMNNDQLECMGRTDYVAYIITTSIRGISDTARQTNSFFIFVLVLILVASFIVFYFINRKMRHSIRALEIDVAEKEKINRRQKEFLANVSHELKTPIALISGYAEGLKDGVADDPDNVSYYVDVIVDEAQKMNTIVKRLLNLDEIESGRIKLEKETFNLTELIRGIVSSFELVSKEKNITVNIISEDDMPVFADEFLIEQAIQNYISNAFHHVKEHGIIETKTGYEDKDNIYVTVYNSGNNIPEEDIDRIWEQFYKIDKAHTRSYGGSGIGLSIVRSVMELSGGTVSVENKPDGVLFKLTIPRN